MNKKAIIMWIITIIWMLVIFAFSANDGAESVSKSKKVTYDIVEVVDKNKSEVEKKKKVEELHPSVRKIAHVLEYTVLCILMIVSLKASNIKDNKILLIALIICIIYAATDELHQYFVNGRSAEYTDVIIDTAGSTIGLLIYEINSRIKKGVKK